MSDRDSSNNYRFKNIKTAKVSPQRLFSAVQNVSGKLEWGVEDYVSERKLVLRNDHLIPGTARLEFLVKARADDPGSEITQTLSFIPRNVAGKICWHLLKPVRSVVLNGMIKQIIKKAEKKDWNP